MRKWFHLLALAVYTPCIVLDPPFLSLAAALAMLTFLTVEVCLSVFGTFSTMEEEGREVEEVEEEKGGGGGGGRGEGGRREEMQPLACVLVISLCPITIGGPTPNV